MRGRRAPRPAPSARAANEIGRARERERRLRRDARGVARGDVPGADERDVQASHRSSSARIARTSSVGSRVVRLVLDGDRARVAEAPQRAHALLDRHDALAPAAREVRLAHRAHVLEVDVEHVRRRAPRSRAPRRSRASPTSPCRRSCRTTPGAARSPRDPREHVRRRLLLRMVLDPEPDAVAREHRADRRRVAREAAADDRRCRARARSRRRARRSGLDPRRVRRDAEAVPRERLARRVDVRVRRPLGMQVRAPDVDRVEAERTRVGEQRVEAARRRSRAARTPPASCGRRAPSRRWRSRSRGRRSSPS